MLDPKLLAASSILKDQITEEFTLEQTLVIWFHILFRKNPYKVLLFVIELQFQLVMRGFQTQLSLGSESSFESNCESTAAATVQVLTGEEALKLEEVEANMKQLQADLHQAKSRNIYLNDLVEEQKRLHFMNVTAVINEFSTWHRLRI